MATTAVNRPPLAPRGPTGGNPHIRVNSDVANSAQQDPGLHSTGQDPGSSSHPQHPIFARPVIYVHAPPPPPFLHYQWPMPLSYPFPGFPGMSYGMVMPPFPPPPYMESPAYILPHAPVQPVDYRRLLHPQAHAPGAPLQNLNQTRRIRLPHATPVRETVNSEVQTEPMHRGVGGCDEGSLLRCSDSGHATASNSPSSLSSNSQQQGSAEVETYTLASNDAKEQLNGPGTSSRLKHGCNMMHPAGINDVQSCRKASQETQRCKDSIVQEPPLIPPCRNAHCNMWSVSSQDSMVPVCSSSQREDEIKERRISVPDILMSWGGGTPQTTMKMGDKVLPQNNHEIPSHQVEVEHERSVQLSPTETKNDPVVVSSADNVTEVISSSKDSEMVFKILKLPASFSEPFSQSTRDSESVELVVRPRLTNGDEMLQSLNEMVNGSETYEDSAEITPYHISLSSCQIKRKINESVWSVESLAPYIPTKEWLQQNGMFEPEVIVEMMGEAENGGPSTQNDSLIVKFGKEKERSHRFSSSDSVPMSESGLIFSTPAEKPHMECETDVAEIKGTEQGQRMVPSEKVPLTSPIPLQSKILAASTEEDMDENGSSEPEANQSPNQESLTVNGQEDRSPCSLEKEETHVMNSAAEDKISSTGQMINQNEVNMEMEDGIYRVSSQMGNVELCVPTSDQKMAQVSPSKGNLVDCAVQCTELQELKCVLCEELKGSVAPNRRHPYKFPDMKKANNGKAEVSSMNGHVQKNSKRNVQWRNRGQEKHNSQQEAYNGYSGKPGKLKGGNGRNPRP